jgi:hypothetical protein
MARWPLTCPNSWYKSAQQFLAVLRALNSTNVEHGYSFCLPEAALSEIAGAAVAPHGIVHQGTINELGQYLSKGQAHARPVLLRPTGRAIHKRSVHHGRTHAMRLQPPLLRIIHLILHLRRTSPKTRIFIQKVDFKSAYQRMHLSTDMAAKCITVVGGLAFVSLRLPFGGRACTSLWSDVSETIMDLSNALALDTTWDPDTLHCPLQHLIPRTLSEPDTVPFAEALSTSVTIPESDGNYKADIFIDDLISVILNDGAGCKRGAASSLLAIHTVGRPVASQEPVPRNELMAEKELIAESLLEKVKTTLGWLLDTRRLLIGLSMDKFAAWSGVNPLYGDRGSMQLQQPGNAGWPTQPRLLHHPPGPTLHEPASLAARRGQAGQGYSTPPASPGRPTTLAVLPPDIIRGDQPQPHLISHPDTCVPL